MSANPLKSKSLLIATIAGVMALPATQARAEQVAQEEGVPCWGINKCKGLGDCGADGTRESGCHGSNACTGQGFLRLDADTCLKIQGGRLTKRAADASPYGRMRPWYQRKS